MKHQNLSNDKRLNRARPLILLAGVIAGVIATLVCGPACADWADQMSEGSGVDRGAMMVSAASGGQPQQQNLDAPALREAMANSLTSDLAASLNGGAVPEAYSAPAFVVPSIPACEDEECGDPDELAD